MTNQRDKSMKKQNDIFMNNKLFVWLLIGTLLILLIPFVLTIHDNGIQGGWKWTDPEDYIFGFVMIFGMSSLFVLTARKVRKYRLLVGLLFLVAFVAIWGELAVGAIEQLINFFFWK